MAVFFLCRLPNWMYVLYKLSNDVQENIFSVITNALGLMVMANCMLNPFLYTFLSETIRLTTFLASIVRGILSPCVKLCKFKNANNECREGKFHAFDNMYKARKIYTLHQKIWKKSIDNTYSGCLGCIHLLRQSFFRFLTLPPLSEFLYGQKNNFVGAVRKRWPPPPISSDVINGCSFISDQSQQYSPMNSTP